MSNKKLFEEAIADAKTVREAAVANAKAALEETFTPKIMSMLEKKLSELEEGDMEEGKEVEEEGYGKEEGMESAIGYESGRQRPEIEEEGDSMEEMNLEAILAELEKEEEGKMEEGEKKDMEESKKEVEEGKKEVEEAKEPKEEGKKVEESLEEADDEAASDDEVTELTVDELKDIIRDVLQDVLGGEEEAGEEAGEEIGDETGEESGDEGESIDLDELLAELDSMEEGKDKEKVEEKKEEDGKKVEESKKKEMEEAKKAKKDLEEAIKVIKFLKKELNEVNLLNAKNTYVNKIFKEKSLSESQKVKVLKTMDNATNVKEAKVIYESLVSSLSISNKKPIKESIGFASKAAGVAPKQPIVESDAAVRRMQQLAGIIK